MRSKFKRKCPTCKARDKMISRCPLCFHLCCNNCSIDKLCIDCFTESKKTMEVNNYFYDKYIKAPLGGLV